MSNELIQEAPNISTDTAPQPVPLWLVRTWFLRLKFYICLGTNAWFNHFLFSSLLTKFHPHQWSFREEFWLLQGKLSLSIWRQASLVAPQTLQESVREDGSQERVMRPDHCGFFLPCLHLNMWNKHLLHVLSSCHLPLPGTHFWHHTSSLSLFLYESVETSPSLLDFPEHSGKNNTSHHSPLYLVLFSSWHMSLSDIFYDILFEYPRSLSLICKRFTFQHFYCLPLCAWNMVSIKYVFLK